MAVTGGAKLKAALQAGRKATRVRTLQVGFYSTARYQDGTPVTNVAAWNEFGTRNKDGTVRVPERPYFRNAIKSARPILHRLMVENLDPKTLAVDQRIGNLLGIAVTNEIAKWIRILKVIDTGKLRQSRTHKLIY